jgi:fucose permease
MYKRKLVFTAACLGMLIFGIVFTTLGAILPSVIEKFGIDMIHAGSLMSFLSIGILIGSLVFGPIADRFGYKALLSFCILFILLGLEGIAWAAQFWILRLSILLIGLGGGIINGATNALVADISEGERSANLSLLGIFFGIGAIGIPFLLGILLNKVPYETFISITGLIVLLPLIFFLFIRFPQPKQAQKFPVREGLGLLKNATLLLFGFILFFESGIEIIVSSWTAEFLKEELLIQPDRAVFYLSIFWVGMVLTRFILGYILKIVSQVTVLLTCLAIAFLGTSLMIFSNTLSLTLPALFLIGIGFAASYPVILGFIADLFPQLSGTAFSIAFVIALIGGTIIPFTSGVIADAFNLRYAFTIILVSILIMFFLFSVARKRLTT